VAEVLPENVRMIQIFREAGYKVEGGFEDGVMRLVFGIDPTDTSVGVMQSREHRAEARSINGFFNARSIAVIGASRRQETIGQTIVRNLVLGGYTGRVFAVNPHAQAVAGLPAYARVQDIPDPVDLAVVAVPAESVEDVRHFSTELGLRLPLHEAVQRVLHEGAPPEHILEAIR